MHGGSFLPIYFSISITLVLLTDALRARHHPEPALISANSIFRFDTKQRTAQDEYTLDVLIVKSVRVCETCPFVLHVPPSKSP